MSDLLPCTYGVRPDESCWISFGDPRRGPHCQADCDLPEKYVKVLVDAYNALAAQQPRGDWRPIAEHDGGTTEVIGIDAGGLIFRTWYFAPSSITKNWLRVGSGKPWSPIAFMPIPSLPAPPALPPEEG